MILGIVLCCMVALIPALTLYFPNIEEIPLMSMLPYFAIMFGLGLLSWTGMYLLVRRKGLASLAAAIWLGVLLNIGRIVPSIHTLFPLAGIKVIAPVVLVILIAVIFGLSRLSEEFLNDTVKVASLAVAAFILSSAIPQFFHSPAQDNNEEHIQSTQFDLSPAQNSDRPNVYWIVSDEYAGLDELKKYYHYDNSQFYNELRNMGFTVSENSYNWSTDTYTILRDILNLQHTPLGKQTKEDAVADPNQPLWTLFRNLGYSVCEVESTNKFRLANRMNIENNDHTPRTSDGNAVANLLLQYSILYRYENEILEFIYPPLSKKSAKNAILSVFEWAENPECFKSETSTCTVIYFQSPHMPYFFDKSGNEIPVEQQTNSKDKQYYLDQLIYVTAHLKKICNTILETDPDSIIILQSDHGQRFVPNVTRLDQTCVLNAVYFRGKQMESILGRNALNTWRIVLQEQFGLDLPLVTEKRLPNEYREPMRDLTEEDPNQGMIPDT